MYISYVSFHKCYIYLQLELFDLIQTENYY